MQWLIRVGSGQHVRRNCPVFVPLEGCSVGDPVAVPVDSPAVLGRTVQLDGCGGNPVLRFVLSELAAGETAEFAVDDSAATGSWDDGVAISGGTDDRIAVSLDNELFTELNYGREWVRPFFYPVVGPTACGVTRNFPMKAALPTEREDHVHHKSLYVAHGDVNGADVWSETEGHGSQVQEEVLAAASGPVAGLLRTANVWLGPDGTKLVSDVRDVWFHRVGAGLRLVDFGLQLRADFGDVTFGDTKEGGLISVRVAGAMKGSSGGLIRNAYGGLTEKECWGKAAPWVDYSGVLEGATVGICVCDHPFNPRYPTRWHVRDYGLFTANPFGLSHYKAGFETNGDFLLAAGESVWFRYRVLIHSGTADDAAVADRFIDYVCPPEATATPC